MKLLLKPFQCVEMSAAYILLGSNIEDRRQYLEKAQERIKDLGIIFQKSSVYETAAWGNENQPDFLNQVICLETSLRPVDLLRSLLKIEKEMGRKRLEKWGSRIIDLDILYFDAEVIEHEDLKIPHPYLHHRRFTLLPLCEIASDFLHPSLQKTNQELLDMCTDKLTVIKKE